MSEVPPSAAAPPKLDYPPFVAVPGVHNFRDLGGYAAYPHGSIRRGWIYRSAEPSQITDAGKAKLKELGIKTFYDLRSEPELERVLGRGDSLDIEGTTRVWCPVFATQDYSPEQLAVRFQNYRKGPEGFVLAYKDILSNGGQAYRTILLHVRDKPDEPFVLHCTAGKDRTGVLAAIMLLLVGVKEDTIASEYSLTEIGLAPWISHLMTHVSAESETEEEKKGAMNMLGAKKESMTASLKMFREIYGTAENYLKTQCQFSNEDIEKIRRNLVVEKEACL